MRYLVSVKRVIDVELNLRIEQGKINEDGLQYVMNAWDENAVEAAVNLKDEKDGEIDVVSIGGEDNKEIMRKALAMGADKGILVNDDVSGADSFGIASILAKVCEKEKYDLVLMGKQAQDTDNGQTCSILAEMLDLPVVTNVAKIEFQDDQTLKLERIGDDGREEVVLKLPALISINDSLNDPRLPSLRGIMQAKKKPIEETNLSELGLSTDQLQGKSKVLEFSAPEQREAGQKFEGDVEENTRKVMGLLKSEAKVI